MIYNKLVRDNIPEIIENKGERAITRILDDNEFKIELEKKLLEECREVIEAKGEDRINELGDVFEVILSLLELENKTFEDVIDASALKRKKRGGFSKKIFLEKVIK